MTAPPGKARARGRFQAALRLFAALGAVAAPALVAQVIAAQSANAQTTYAQGTYGGPQGYDRYGGGGYHPTTGAPQAMAGPTLTWAGKVEAPTGQRSVGQAQPRPQPRYAPFAYAAMTPATQATPPTAAVPETPPAGWRWLPPAAPNTIYDPVPPAAAPSPPPASPPDTSLATARRYSVHRDYGIAPDPIPLPPQFFGATADLTQPETPDPARRGTAANGKPRNPAQPEDGQ